MPRNSFDYFIIRSLVRLFTVMHALEPPVIHSHMSDLTDTHTHERANAENEAASVKKSTKNQTERKRYYQKLHSVCLVNTWLLFLKFQEMRSRKNISKFSEARDWQWMDTSNAFGRAQSKQYTYSVLLLLL